MEDAAKAKGHVKVSDFVHWAFLLIPAKQRLVLFLWENSTNMQREHPKAVEITVLQCE